MYELKLLVIGMIAMGSFVIGLFFLKYWRLSRDGLFGAFALAFFIFGIERLALAQFGISSEQGGYLFWLRLLGFLLILYAVINKNRESG